MTDAPFSTDPVSGAVQLDPVLDAMVESMIVIDEAGTMERVNKATKRMFGYAPAELLGKNIKRPSAKTVRSFRPILLSAKYAARIRRAT